MTTAALTGDGYRQRRTSVSAAQGVAETKGAEPPPRMTRTVVSGLLLFPTGWCPGSGFGAQAGTRLTTLSVSAMTGGDDVTQTGGD